MSLFVFNNSQELIKSIPNDNFISVVQEQEINKTDNLFVEVPVNVWKELKEKAFYMAVQDPYERYSFHMYKVWKEETQTDTVALEGIQIAFDELKAYGYIKDRRFNQSEPRAAAQVVVEGTDWQLGYIDDTLPLVNTNFYYISRLEALSKLLEVTGAEVRFRVEISGNRIVSKRMDLYRELSEFKGKRFAYGSKLLEVVKQEDNAEIYTALVGRGRGEETDTGGFGRRITFEEVEWSKANGDPVNKPLGQEYVELPEMTALYGYPDGTPRTGIVEFQDTEDPELLLEQTYEALVNTSRPKVQFKATVVTTGDMQLGETVAIIRRDLGFRYLTRVYKVRRDYLNNQYTEVDLGDKLSQTTGDLIKQINTSINKSEGRLEQVIQIAANGKNRIFRGPVEPTSGMMVGDLWYKPIGDGEVEMYQWNGAIWELVVSSAMNSETKERIEEARGIAESAQKEAESASSRVQKAIDDADEAYKYADSAIRAANGKNTVYRGSAKPVDGEENDIWFQNVAENGQESTKMYVHDGNDWVLRAYDASELAGTLDLSQLNVINLNMDSATGGSLHLDRGLRVENNGKDVLKAENGNVTMDVDNLLIKSKGIDEVIGTQFYQDGLSVGFLFEENGEIKSIFNLGPNGPYLSGRNIVLDGDTIVDGSFTVTDEIFAENMSIDKFTAGTLNAAEVNLINVNVDSLVGNKSNFVQSAWNAINSRADINGSRLRFTHNDGTSTEIGASGIRRVTPSDNRNYHYLFYATTFIYGETSSNARWIQLPDDFKGKDFSVYLAIADSIQVPSYKWSLQRFVCTVHPDHRIDYTRARVPVIAYKSSTLMDGAAPDISTVQGMLFAIY